jgi:hypothetical protein
MKVQEDSDEGQNLGCKDTFVFCQPLHQKGKADICPLEENEISDNLSFKFQNQKYESKEK